MNATTATTKITADQAKGAGLPVIIMIALLTGMILPVAVVGTAITSIWLPFSTALTYGAGAGVGLVLLGALVSFLTPAPVRL